LQSTVDKTLLCCLYKKEAACSEEELYDDHPPFEDELDDSSSAGKSVARLTDSYCELIDDLTRILDQRRCWSRDNATASVEQDKWRCANLEGLDEPASVLGCRANVVSQLLRF